MAASTPTVLPENRFPGQRLGLPEAGSGSIARAGRRIAAITVDWVVAAVIGAAFFDYAPHAVLGIFAVMQFALLATAGSSLGHALLGLRLVLLGGGYPGLWRPLLRTLLLCLAVPALIWNADQRGIHDLMAGTVLVRR